MEVITTIETAFAQLTNAPSKSEAEVSNGRWTKEEHERFVEAIKNHGKNWKKVEEAVGTRTGAQIRSHAQKFFLKIEKELKTNQKAKGNKQNGKSTKNKQTAILRSEDSLKGNLSFNEINENLTEASEISTVLPVSPDTHLVAAEKSIEYVSNSAATTPTKPSDIQSESSNSSKLSKKQLLSKLQACEEKVEEYHSLVKKFAASYTTNNTLNYYREEQSSKPYHHFVYVDLMNYFTIFNKNAKSLKLSDLVDHSYKTTSNNSEESYVDAPAGKKKVKVL